MYSVAKTNDLNEARFKIFCETYKTKNPKDYFNIDVKNYDGSKLPPCKAEFCQHLLRTAYISNIWKSAYLQNIEEFSPLDYVWKEENEEESHKNKWNFNWFEGDMSPHFISG